MIHDDPASGAAASTVLAEPPPDDGGAGRIAPQPVEPSAAASHASGPFHGARKAAVFVLSLEEEVASRLLRLLNDDELKRISAEIATLGVVDKDTVSGVLHEFRELERAHSVAREGGMEQAVRLLERTFPKEKASRVVQSLVMHREGAPFSFLEALETDSVLACLEEEHPQTLAVVLAHMNPAKAAELLERLPPPARRDVLERIAGLEPANAEAVHSLEISLRKHLDAVRFASLGEAGGVKAVAEILRAAGQGGKALLDDLRAGQPTLADEVDKHYYVFEDLIFLDDRALQSVLKEVETRRLALALKDASEGVRKKVLRNLSRRAAELLEEEVQGLGPVRFSEIESSRRAVLDALQQLEAQGQVFVSGRGREENRIVY